MVFVMEANWLNTQDTILNPGHFEKQRAKGPWGKTDKLCFLSLLHTPDLGKKGWLITNSLFLWEAGN